MRTEVVILYGQILYFGSYINFVLDLRNAILYLFMFVFLSCGRIRL